MAEPTTTTEPRGRSSRQIRQEIRRKRADMDDTIRALEDRLSPGRVVDEIWTRIRSGNADGAGVSTVLRDHPVPVALMGIGLGWLAIESATGRSASPGGGPSSDPGTHRPAEGRVGPYEGDAARDDADWPHAGVGTRAKAKVSDAADGVKDAVRDAGETAGDLTERAGDRARKTGERLSGMAAGAKARASEKADSARERASEVAQEVKEGASRASDSLRTAASESASRAVDVTREQGRRARSGFIDLLDENPLALGAAAFGLGLAGGLAFATSRVEDRAVGSTAETVKDEARRIGREKAEAASAVASDAAMAAKEEAERQKEEKKAELAAAGEDARQAVDRVEQAARDAARNVGEAARDAAKTRAEREGLTASGTDDEGEAGDQPEDEGPANPGTSGRGH